MWFDPSMSQAYAEGIVPALSDAGYIPVRIDQKEHNNKIDDEIIAEIRQARFVVADFTCGIIGEGPARAAVARGSVYYEAGFAQGIGTPVIWTVREDCIDKVHFDARQYAHILWKDPADLRAQLNKRILALFGQFLANGA
jgi:hypothetical protein